MQPHRHPNDSAMERLWAAEVRRLHALWHLGPPRGTDSTSPIHKSGAVASAGLGPASSTRFKRAEGRRKKKAEKMQGRAAKRLEEQLRLCSEERSEASHWTEEAPPHETEWPCEPLPVPIPEAGWDGWEISSKKLPPSSSPAPSVSQEEQARAAAVRMQKKAVRTFQGFLSREGISEDDEEEEDDRMDEDMNGKHWEISDYFNFFVSLFEEDGELRSYYERSWEKGEFFCLVCEGIGVKVGKKFLDCVALVQHSNSIAKTKRRKAHRSFGRAICRVLGWDIARLPSIVLDMGKTIADMANDTDSQKDGIPAQSDQVSVETHQDGVHRGDECRGLEADNVKRMMIPSSDATWTCKSLHVSPPEVGCDLYQKPPTSLQCSSISKEDQCMTAIVKVHQKAVGVCRNIFLGEKFSDFEKEGHKTDILMDEDVDDDVNLRAYYEKNWEKGIFFCLVCEGTREQLGKSYNGCSSLVQHSNSTKRTERNEAHRAYVSAICHILSWDPAMLPSVVSDARELIEETSVMIIEPQDHMLEQNNYILLDVPQAGAADCEHHNNCSEEAPVIDPLIPAE